MAGAIDVGCLPGLWGGTWPMKLFGQLVRTVVNTALLPVAVVKDVVTMGNVGELETHTAEAIQRLKDEAKEDDD